MKHWIAGLALVSLLLVVGCDTVNHSQLQVRVPRGEEKTRATVPAAERETVKRVLKQIANRLRYEDRTQLSLIPDTICSYAEPDVRYPISFRAWVSRERVIVDVVQTRPDAGGESVAYSKVMEQIMSALNEEFGERLTMVHKTQQTHSGSAMAK